MVRVTTATASKSGCSVAMDPLAKLIGKPTHMSMDMDRHRPLLWVPQEQSNKSLQPEEQSKKSLLTSQPQQRMVHSASRR